MAGRVCPERPLGATPDEQLERLGANCEIETALP